MGYYTWYTLDIIKDPDNQEEDFATSEDDKSDVRCADGHVGAECQQRCAEGF